MDTLGIAVSGMRSASTRIAASAHNVANLLTRDFQPQRVVQTAQAAGGSQARVEDAPSNVGVNLEQEFVDQILARTQFKASARLVGVEADMRGSLLDVLA